MGPLSAAGVKNDRTGVSRPSIEPFAGAARPSGIYQATGDHQNA